MSGVMVPRMLPIHIPPTANPKSSPWSVFGRPQVRWLFLGSMFMSFTLYWLWSPYYYNPLDHGSIDIPLPWSIEPGVPLQSPLPSLPPPPPKPQVSWDKRKDEVRDAFVHALSGYMQYAFPDDELLSFSGGKSNKSVTFLFLNFPYLSSG